MAKRLALVSTAMLFSLALIGGGCRAATEPTTPEPAATKSTTSATTEEPGSWIPKTRGPWDGTIYRAASLDGLAFTGKTLVLKQAGVPNLLLLPNGDLILTYQYFSSETRDLFDVIAYSVSTDDGTTWSNPAAVALSGLPSPAGPAFKPMDPTLVRADDGSLRLYFTYHAKGKNNAELYVAVASEGTIDSPFVVETIPALSVSGKGLLDPAVTFFGGLWHHYSWQMENDDNYHSTSEDGIAFARQDDITLSMDFLGQVVPFGNGLRFYGTDEGNVVSAYSDDGQTWTMDAGFRTMGADPGVQRLADGSYLMIYTAANFNE